MGKASSRLFKGVNHPQWKGGCLPKMCEICGTEFVPQAHQIKEGSGKYCSPACYGLANRGEKNPHWSKVKRVCQECKTVFFEKPSRVEGGRGKYCSPECQYKAASRLYRGTNNPTWKGGCPTKKCEECGKDFVPSRGQIKLGKGKYCSTECMGKSQSKNRVGENHPAWVQKITKKCESCEKEILRTEWQISRGHDKYCSLDCYGVAHRGEKSPMWKGGISFEPYCPKFNKRFREKVRKWFDYNCIICGEPEGKKILRVHHVYYNKQACCEVNVDGEYIFNIDNEQVKVIGNPNKFVALCQSCHSKSNANRVYWARYFEEIINYWYQGRSWVD